VGALVSPPPIPDPDLTGVLDDDRALTLLGEALRATRDGATRADAIGRALTRGFRAGRVHELRDMLRDAELAGDVELARKIRARLDALQVSHG
jgi:hypothetical protein